MGGMLFQKHSYFLHFVEKFTSKIYKKDGNIWLQHEEMGERVFSKKIVIWFSPHPP